MNIVAIKGNIVKEPEVKYLPNGTALVDFNIAVNEVWMDAQGQKQERTHFFGCGAWGKTAENIAKFFGKGSPILIEGRLTQEKWEDKETGKGREKTKIRVERFDFCGGDKKQSTDKSDGERNADRDRSRAQTEQNARDEAALTAGDDIPF